MAKRKSRKGLIITVVLFLIVALGALAFIISSGGNKPVGVTMSKVERRTITQTVSAIGKIEPETEVKVSSQTSGEIIFLGVKEGDTVKAGQLLVRIKPDIIETQLEQYAAASEAAKTDIDVQKTEKDRLATELARMEGLYKKEFVSKQELDRLKSQYDNAVNGQKVAKSRYDQAMSMLKQMRRTADRSTITAPINGVVTLLNIEKGEKVVGTEMMQGTEMMRISDLRTMNAVVDVDENDIVNVKVGDTARIEIDALPDRIYRGYVIELGHSAKVNQVGSQDQVTNFSVKIRLLDTDGRLRPGMSCNVDIETQTKQGVISVPLQAVTIRDTKSSSTPDLNTETEGKAKSKKEEKMDKAKPQQIVFVKDGNKVKVRNVETGISDNGFIEITKGLKESEEIVSGSFQAVSKLLNDGSLVTIEAKKTKSVKK